MKLERLTVITAYRLYDQHLYVERKQAARKLMSNHSSLNWSRQAILDFLKLYLFPGKEITTKGGDHILDITDIDDAELMLTIYAADTS